LTKHFSDFANFFPTSCVSYRVWPFLLEYEIPVNRPLHPFFVNAQQRTLSQTKQVVVRSSPLRVVSAQYLVFIENVSQT
jgi:hypothetical protein